MKYIELSQKQINNAKIQFFNDMNYKMSSLEDIEKFLKRKKYKCEMLETKNLIYFILFDKKNNEIMYSRPLQKYEAEADEIAFMVKTPEGPLKSVCLTESTIPLHEYSKVRHGLITPKELKEKEDSRKKMMKDFMNFRNNKNGE